MSSAVLWVMVLGLLLAASALALWAFAQQRQKLNAIHAHLHERLQTPPASAQWRDRNAQQELPVDAAVASTGGLPVPAVLAVAVSAPLLYGGAAVVLVLVLLVALLAGPVAATAALVVLGLCLAFVLWLRLQKHRRRLVGQLPGFLDSMVRLVTIGNATQAAFQMATASTKAPLRAVMEQVGSLSRAGMDLEAAVLHVARQQRIEELHLLGAILRVSVRYGGRVDVLLERVGHFMRDRAQAEEELSAMTAETRLSAWVLSLLPVVVCGLIISVNAGYFVRMWEDPDGRRLFWMALGLQSAGILMLYRMARLS